jgi:hypothetical protein
VQVLKTANSYDQLFGLTPSAGSGFGSLSLTADLKVAPSNPKGGTDRKPMTVVASNPAAMRLIDQSRHSLVREWIARRDVVWGAYGIAPDLYGGTESDGFQENLNSGVSAAMAWGFKIVQIIHIHYLWTAASARLQVSESAADSGKRPPLGCLCRFSLAPAR